MASGRPDWHSIITIEGRSGTNFVPIKVDGAGQMYIAMTGQTIDVDNLPIDYFKTGQDIGTIQGEDEGAPHVVAVDGSGIILSRMKGAASGDSILKIVDDCGDTTTVADWVELLDGLTPVENEVYVKQGIKSMALGVDADKDVSDECRWTNVNDQGDLSNYQHDYLYLWVYFETLDYLRAFNWAFIFDIGTVAINRITFEFTKADLAVGWNLLKCDLDNPDLVTGNIDWSNIGYLRIRIMAVTDNVDDFTAYVDSIMFVRPTPGAGTLSDIAVDENGVMLSKMTGAYAGLVKPIVIDQEGHMLSVIKGSYAGVLKTIEVDTDGVMKANLSAQGLDFIYQKPLYTEQKLAQDINFNFGGIGTRDCITINGSGIVLSGYVWFYVNVANDPTVILSVDDVQCESMLLSHGIERNRTAPSSGNLFLTRYDELEDYACVGISPGITFETKLIIKVHNPVAGAIEGDVILNYALVPAR